MYHLARTCRSRGQRFGLAVMRRGPVEVTCSMRRPSISKTTCSLPAIFQSMVIRHPHVASLEVRQRQCNVALQRLVIFDMGPPIATAIAIAGRPPRTRQNSPMRFPCLARLIGSRTGWRRGVTPSGTSLLVSTRNLAQLRNSAEIVLGLNLLPCRFLGRITSIGDCQRGGSRILRGRGRSLQQVDLVRQNPRVDDQCGIAPPDFVHVMVRGTAELTRELSEMFGSTNRRVWRG